MDKSINFSLTAMDIKREEILNKLINARFDGLVKIITGIRRCGKSYLLFNLFKAFLLEEGVSPDHILEFQLDQLRNEPLRDPLLLSQAIRERLIDNSQYYIFIDEIQMCRKVLREGLDLSRIAPEDRETAYITFYDVLNEFRVLPNVDIYVTGSNSKTLSSDIATNFRDRGESIQMHPFSFSEIASFRGSHDSAILREYMTYGGMPLAVLKNSEEEKKKYLRDLFSKVYIKDIVEHNKLKDDLVIDRLTDLLCSSIGSLTNLTKLVNALDSVMHVKTSINSLKKCLDMLEDAFIFHRADRYDIKGKHYLDYPAKFFAEDVGLRNARLNFRQVERTHLMENVIYNELLRRGCAIDVGVVSRESHNNGIHKLSQYEIDFVVNSDDGKIYIQSAFSIDDAEKREQEILPFRLCNDFFSRLVVVDGDERPWTDDEGITYVGIIPFLLDASILRNKMK